MSAISDRVPGMECVVLTPAQSNDIILEKLTHLEPVLICVRDELIRLKEDLSNGIIHWDEILAQHELGRRVR